MRNTRPLAFLRDERGAAAVEMALVGGMLATAMLNVVEVGRYASMASQVTAATQAAAQAALMACPPNAVPMTPNCAGGAPAMLTALRSGSLGADVRYHGTPTERWYCLNASGVLQDMAPSGDPPGNCAAANRPDESPALYLRVQAEFTFTPIFPGLTVTESFDDVIVRTAWMRLL